ncbi:MAG: class I SAM-dependent methyltransferase [Solirubrobacterales bacterium]|nr:class I SAM-dependent methyltransferase [Solirubrobacterales bacterium]
MEHRSKNLDQRTVADFGAEWAAFDQSAMSEAELTLHFDGYFGIFPWASLPARAIGFDAGCGSGRWARRVAPRVGHLRCVDASPAAVAVARRALQAQANCSVETASIEALPFDERSMDFGYSLGVLHHLPDPEAGLASCVAKLKPGAPFLVYLYYALDGRPAWFRAIWRAAEAVRKVLCRLPFRLKLTITTMIATVIYWPLARTALLAEKLGADPEGLPLSTYRRRSFYSMRTDALDRFGTRLEHRFRRDEIAAMMERCGLRDITFSEHAPYWCAVGRRVGDDQPR